MEHFQISELIIEVSYIDGKIYLPGMQLMQVEKDLFSSAVF